MSSVTSTTRRYVDTFSNKEGSNSLLLGSDKGTNLYELVSFEIETNSSFPPRPMLGHVMTAMFFASRNFKIAGAIVFFVIVLVVNQLVGSELAAESFGHNETMLIFDTPIDRLSYVPFFVGLSLSLVATSSGAVVLFSASHLPSGASYGRSTHSTYHWSPL